LEIVVVNDELTGPLLHRFGVTADKLRREVSTLVTPITPPSSGYTVSMNPGIRKPKASADSAATARKLTRRMLTCFGLASRETEALGDDHVGPEHLLLAILKEGGGVGVKALNQMGVDASELRKAVYMRIVEAPGDSDPTAREPTDEEREERLDRRRRLAEAQMSPEDRVVFTSSDAAQVFCVLDGLNRLFDEEAGPVIERITQVIGGSFADRAGQGDRFTPDERRRILRSIVSGLRRQAADQLGD